jgi:tRNA(Ile)-lysidine synthase
MDIIERVTNFCLEKRLIERGDRVLVAVSGGPDSTALLHILIKIREDLDLTLSIAHFNHGLRGKESDADQTFVEKMAKACDIICYTEKFTVPRGRHESPEESARGYRYAFLYRILRKTGYNLAATGHTRDDNIETILYRLTTGTGPAGLTGIVPKSGSIIHPLLIINKKQVLEFLSREGLTYRIDSSNYDMRIPRNKIRSHIIPLLQQINPAIETHISTLAHILQEENDVIDKLVHTKVDTMTIRKSDDSFAVDYTRFLGLDRPLRRRALLYMFNEVTHALREKRGYLSAGVLETLASKSVEGNKLLYSNKLVSIRKVYNMLVVQKSVVEKKVNGYLYSVHNFEETLFVKEIRRTFRFRVTRKPKEFIRNSLYFDCCTLHLPITVRSRRGGDRISLRNTGTKKLKDLFIDHKVPAEIRTVVPVLECNGTVIGVFCCLYGKSNRVAADVMIGENTEAVLVCELKEEDSSGTAGRIEY